MFEYYFTFRAVTPAQSARHVLHTGGVAAVLGRAPRQLSMQGCGYVLRVAPQAGLRALGLLRTAHMPFVHMYRVYGSGAVEEVTV